MTARVVRADAALCRCMRRTGPRRTDPAVSVPPVLVGTRREGVLADVRYVHGCGLPDEILDPRRFEGR